MTRTKAAKAKRAARTAARAPRPGCPYPNKGGYTKEVAVATALRSSRRTGRPIRIYDCVCGTMHLTKRKKKPTRKDDAQNASKPNTRKKNPPSPTGKG